MAVVPFEALLVADIWVSGAYTMILHATLVRARRSAPSGEGEFRVPGGKVGLWLNALVPGATWCVFLALTAREHAAVGVGLLLLGPVVFAIVNAMKERPAMAEPS
jgi:hypothetical protein